MKVVGDMPRIVPIRDLRKTSELSELAHTEQESIFITKNGYSNLVVMSAELYDRYVSILRTDQDIFEAEEEVKNGGETVDAADVFDGLDKKYYE